MKRSRVIRRFSAAVLVCISALLLVALAPLLLDLRSGDLGRGVLGVQALQSDSLIIDRPYKIGVAPDLTLLSGTVSLARGAADAGQIVVLSGAIIEIALASAHGSEPAAGDPLHQAVTPLIESIAVLSMDRLQIRRGTIRLRWSGGRTLDLANVEGDLTVRQNQASAATGTFTYLKEKYSFDTQIGPMTQKVADADPLQGGRRALQLNLKSDCLSIGFDGQVEVGETIKLKGGTELRTPDMGKLAAALGYLWQNQAGGPPAAIKGPLQWADGTLSFGRSEVSLGDQAGVGAVAISLRDGRPRLEATLAFAALDVAPLLQPSPAAVRSQVSPASAAAWRSIGVVFPVFTTLDAELRLSAGRLQWNGAPVGRGAMTVSASGGKMHGDIAELFLGGHSGSVQFAVESSVPRAPVSLRGRIDSADIAPVAQQIFGTSLLRGHAASQFAIAGPGETLGEVIDQATGRGSIEMRDGQVLMDLAGLQRQMTSVAGGERPAGWGTLTQISALDALDAKLQLRGNGTVAIEQMSAVSKGLLASVQGTIDLAASELDLLVRVAPASAVRLGVSRTAAAGVARAVAGREGLSIRGPWSVPVLAAADVELTP